MSSMLAPPSQTAPVNPSRDKSDVQIGDIIAESLRGLVIAEVDLMVRDETVKVDKQLLTLVSPVFAELFARMDGKEEKEKKEKKIKFDHDPAVFTKLIDILKWQRFDKDALEVEELVELVNLTAHYKMQLLGAKFADVLMSKLTHKNMYQTYLKLEAGDAKATCARKIAETFDLRSRELSDLLTTIVNVDDMIEFVKTKTLWVNEQALMETLTEWYRCWKDGVCKRKRWRGLRAENPSLYADHKDDAGFGSDEADAKDRVAIKELFGLIDLDKLTFNELMSLVQAMQGEGIYDSDALLKSICDNLKYWGSNCHACGR